MATPHNDTSTRNAGPDFVVSMPPDAVAEEVWLILVAKNGGFPVQPETRVMVNSVSLTLGELVDSDERVLVYRLPFADFGVGAAGEYPYEETGSAEEEVRDGAGISGATLAVRYSEPDGRGRRRVALLAGYASAVGDSFPRAPSATAACRTAARWWSPSAWPGSAPRSRTGAPPFRAWS